MINLDELIAHPYGNTDKSDCTTKRKRQPRENSYSNVIRQHVKSLNVAEVEQNHYYSIVHTIMGEAGIIDSQKTADATKNDKRYKPFDNSPYGEFVDYEPTEGGRKHVNSYLLNEVGMAKVKEILTNHVKDRCLTKNTIPSAQQFRDELKSKMDVEFLKTYLQHQGIEITHTKKKDGIVFRALSMENQHTTIPYTCYFNNPTKVQYGKADNTKAFTHVFWLIHNLEVPVICNDTQEKAIRAARIFREWWNLQFNGKTEWGVRFDVKTSTEPVQSTPGSEPSTQSVNADELAAEVKALRGTVEQLTSMMTALMKHLNCDVPTRDVTTTSDKVEDKIETKTAIINKILELTALVPTKNRFKSVSLEQIAKESKPKRKKDLQQAYDILKERGLLTAKYRPEKGWKFDFKRRSIELQYRVDNRNSAVYGSRHRPLDPPIIDGKPVKELGDKGQSYSLPYGLEKLDYSYKTVFVAEGIFDSCFLKNCLAQSNWILPHEMSKVIDIYREAGFQIIHVPDNYHIGDKGGLKFYHHVINTRDWLSKGDKVFNWSIYSDCDDLNTIAMKYELDEIDAQTIIDHSWNEEEVRENYDKHFSEWLEVCKSKCSKEEWERFASSVGVSCKVTKEEVIEHEPAEQDNQSCSDEENEDWSEILSADKVKQHVTPADKQDEQPHHSCSDEELEAIFEQMERDEQRTADEVKERELMKKRYEEHLEQEMWEMEKTTQAIYNPQSYLWKTPGITIGGR